jgi:hypothetical protein
MRCSYRPYIGPAWPLPLEGLQHLPSLQRLTLHTTNVPRPWQLRALNHLASLTHLAMLQHNLEGSVIAEEHLEVLADLTQLRSLDLHIGSNDAMSGDETEAVYEVSQLVQLEVRQPSSCGHGWGMSASVVNKQQLDLIIATTSLFVITK